MQSALIFTVNTSNNYVMHPNHMSDYCIYCMCVSKMHGKGVFLRNSHSFHFVFEQTLHLLPHGQSPVIFKTHSY